MADTITNEQVTSLWEMYQNGLAYQVSCGLSKDIPKYVRFFEGRQWPAPTKNTKNLPRPMVNIIKLICRNKKGAILATPVKIIYRTENDTADAEKFNRFAEYIGKEIGQDALDKKGVDDGVKKGAYFFHYYWDSEAEGKDGRVEGGLRCEIVDILSIFFADPTQQDEQKQEWILIASRENIKSVKAKCDRDVDKDAITADENEDKYGTVEQEGDKLCTVLTRYFRQNGEVYCEQATKNIVFKKAFPITPDLISAGKEIGIEEDAPNNSLPDSGRGKSLIPKRTKARLYPIVVGNYEIRERSIYGLGEVEGLIPNQKAINFNLAMALLNNQEMAWGKYVVHPNALKGQTITNEPGQTLVDYSGTGTGIKKMTETGMSGQPINLVEELTQLTRTMTGATEVMTGETVGGSMSGAAIAQLQSQAQLPIEELKDAFWLMKEKQGRVLAQFFKLYYAEKEFSYADENAPEGEQKRVVDTFSSRDFENVEFSVVVEATAGTKASSAGDINVLDVLLGKGAISLKTYLRAYPRDALSNRSEILKGIEEDEQDALKQMTAQLQSVMQQYEALVKTAEEQQKTVDRVTAVIDENTRLKTFIAELYTEASAKIREGNRQIQMGNQKIAETTKDASEMATALWNNGNGVTPNRPNAGAVNPMGAGG